MGYKSYGATNVHYGTLARRVAEYARVPAPDGAAAKVLVTFVPPGARGNDQWLWVMRPELAAALESLGWVRPATPVPTLRLVTWNCAKAGERKLPHVQSLRPDVLVVPECGRPRTGASDPFVWFGPKLWHGLLVKSWAPWRVSPGPPPPADCGVYAAAEVPGPDPFRLLGVWTKPLGKGRTAYVRSLHRALDHYADWLKAGPAVVMGDFNANPGWAGRPEQPVWGRRLRDEFGLVSASHAFCGCDFGTEPHPTFHFQKSADGPWHLDYCFVPAGWNHRIRHASVGCRGLWLRHSDHCPLSVDLALP